MEQLYAGFGRADITPKLPCHLQGNSTERIARVVVDPLYARCLALRTGEKTAFLLSFDLVGIGQALSGRIRQAVADALGCGQQDVFVGATHTHTGPTMTSKQFPMDLRYHEDLCHLGAQAARQAANDLRPAELRCARGEAPGIAFIRRYRMKDGSIRTNPGRRNPEIAGPASEGDDTLQLLRIVREGAGDIALVNFQCHADVVKTGMPQHAVSADYPGMLCAALEGAVPGARCLFFNGTEGDLNHVDVNCPEWDANGGLEHGLHMARTLAGRVLAMYTKARPVAPGLIRTAQRVVELPTKRPTADEVERSRALVEAFEGGHPEVIPYPEGSMQFITALYGAKKVLSLAKEQGDRTVCVAALRVGDAAFAAIPGEGFCAIGRQIREQSPYPNQFILGLTNGHEGYFPMRDAFEAESADSYEAKTSPFQPGVGERLADTALELLNELNGAEAGTVK